MNNPDVILLLTRERQHELRDEAARARLIRQAEPAGPGPADRALAVIGTLLISAGERLQARRTPVASCCPR